MQAADAPPSPDNFRQWAMLSPSQSQTLLRRPFSAEHTAPEQASPPAKTPSPLMALPPWALRLLTMQQRALLALRQALHAARVDAKVLAAALADADAGLRAADARERPVPPRPPARSLALNPRSPSHYQAAFSLRNHPAHICPDWALAEALSLMLDLLNWMLREGPPFSHRAFWLEGVPRAAAMLEACGATLELELLRWLVWQPRLLIAVPGDGQGDGDGNRTVKGVQNGDGNKDEKGAENGAGMGASPGEQAAAEGARTPSSHAGGEAACFSPSAALLGSTRPSQFSRADARASSPHAGGDGACASPGVELLASTPSVLRSELQRARDRLNLQLMRTHVAMTASSPASWADAADHMFDWLEALPAKLPQLPLSVVLRAAEAGGGGAIAGSDSGIGGGDAGGKGAGAGGMAAGTDRGARGGDVGGPRHPHPARSPARVQLGAPAGHPIHAVNDANSIRSARSGGALAGDAGGRHVGCAGEEDGGVGGAKAGHPAYPAHALHPAARVQLSAPAGHHVHAVNDTNSIARIRFLTHSEFLRASGQPEPQTSAAAPRQRWSGVGGENGKRRENSWGSVGTREHSGSEFLCASDLPEPTKALRAFGQPAPRPHQTGLPMPVAPPPRQPVPQPCLPATTLRQAQNRFPSPTSLRPNPHRSDTPQSGIALTAAEIDLRPGEGTASPAAETELRPVCLAESMAEIELRPGEGMALTVDGPLCGPLRLRVVFHTMDEALFDEAASGGTTFDETEIDATARDGDAMDEALVGVAAFDGASMAGAGLHAPAQCGEHSAAARRAAERMRIAVGVTAVVLIIPQRVDGSSQYGEECEEAHPIGADLRACATAARGRPRPPHLPPRPQPAGAGSPLFSPPAPLPAGLIPASAGGVHAHGTFRPAPPPAKAPVPPATAGGVYARGWRGGGHGAAGGHACGPASPRLHGSAAPGRALAASPSRNDNAGGVAGGGLDGDGVGGGVRTRPSAELALCPRAAEATAGESRGYPVRASLEQRLLAAANEQAAQSQPHLPQHGPAAPPWQAPELRHSPEPGMAPPLSWRGSLRPPPMAACAGPPYQSNVHAAGTPHAAPWQVERAAICYRAAAKAWAARVAALAAEAARDSNMAASGEGGGAHGCGVVAGGGSSGAVANQTEAMSCEAGTCPAMSNGDAPPSPAALGLAMASRALAAAARELSSLSPGGVTAATRALAALSRLPPRSDAPAYEARLALLASILVEPAGGAAAAAALEAHATECISAVGAKIAAAQPAARAREMRGLQAPRVATVERALRRAAEVQAEVRAEGRAEIAEGEAATAAQAEAFAGTANGAASPAAHLAHAAERLSAACQALRGLSRAASAGALSLHNSLPGLIQGSLQITRASSFPPMSLLPASSLPVSPSGRSPDAKAGPLSLPNFLPGPIQDSLHTSRAAYMPDSFFPTSLLPASSLPASPSGSSPDATTGSVSLQSSLRRPRHISCASTLPSSFLSASLLPASSLPASPSGSSPDATAGATLGCDEAAAVNGDSAPTVNGDSAPTVNGDSVPTVNSDSVPTVNGDSVPTVNGDAASTMNGVASVAHAARECSSPCSPAVFDPSSPAVGDRCCPAADGGWEDVTWYSPFSPAGGGSPCSPELGNGPASKGPPAVSGSSSPEVGGPCPLADGGILERECYSPFCPAVGGPRSPAERGSSGRECISPCSFAESGGSRLWRRRLAMASTDDWDVNRIPRKQADGATRAELRAAVKADEWGVNCVASTLGAEGATQAADGQTRPEVRTAGTGDAGGSRESLSSESGSSGEGNLKSPAETSYETFEQGGIGFCDVQSLDESIASRRLQLAAELERMALRRTTRTPRGDPRAHRGEAPPGDARAVLQPTTCKPAGQLGGAPAIAEQTTLTPKAHPGDAPVFAEPDVGRLPQATPGAEPAVMYTPPRSGHLSPHSPCARTHPRYSPFSPRSLPLPTPPRSGHLSPHSPPARTPVWACRRSRSPHSLPPRTQGWPLGRLGTPGASLLLQQLGLARGVTPASPVARSPHRTDAGPPVFTAHAVSVLGAMQGILRPGTCSARRLSPRAIAEAMGVD